MYSWLHKLDILDGNTCLLVLSLYQSHSKYEGMWNNALCVNPDPMFQDFIYSSRI